MNMRPRRSIPRLTFEETWDGLKAPEDSMAVDILFAELSSHAEFYEATKDVRQGIQENYTYGTFDYRRAAGAFLRQINLYKGNVTMNARQFGKTKTLTTRCAVAKLLLDYYLDEIELGNLIY